jgi:uncharacterized protein YcfJ
MIPLRLALAGFGLLLATAPAAANPYSIYSERQRGETVILEHNPVPAGVAVARVSRTAVATPRRAVRSRTGVKRRVVRRTAAVHRYTGIAGGCRDGGYVQRVVAGRPVPLQREVCHNISIRLTGPYVVR